MKTGNDLIIEERKKQIEKGYTTEHDNRHNSSYELTRVALYCIEQALIKLGTREKESYTYPVNWSKAFKFKISNMSVIKLMTVAGAFFIAERERTGNDEWTKRAAKVASSIDYLKKTGGDIDKPSDSNEKPLSGDEIIAYRGKRKADNSWAYGGIIAPPFSFDGKTYIVASQFFENDEEKEHHVFIEVHPETVGRFTGVLDKKRKHIFGGDIVKWEVGAASIATGAVGVVSEIHRVSYSAPDWIPFCDFGSWSDDYEIIGNEFDNPELIR